MGWQECLYYIIYKPLKRSNHIELLRISTISSLAVNASTSSMLLPPLYKLALISDPFTHFPSGTLMHVWDYYLLFSIDQVWQEIGCFDVTFKLLVPYCLVPLQPYCEAIVYKSIVLLQSMLLNLCDFHCRRQWWKDQKAEEVRLELSLARLYTGTSHAFFFHVSEKL